MAIEIPSYQPQVRERAIPDVRARDAGVGQALESQGDIAGAFGKAASSIAGTANDIQSKMDKLAKEQRDRADESWANDYKQKAIQKQNELLWNDKDGLYTTRRGELAIKGTDDVLSKYSSFFDELDATATSDKQKELARAIRQQKLVEAQELGMRHEAKEIAEVEKGRADAYVKTLKDDAVLNYMLPGKVEANIQESIATLNKYNSRAGVPYEQTKQKMLETVSETRKDVIDRMLANGQDQLAQGYYNNFKGQFTADHTVAIEKDLELASLRGKAQRSADTILSKSNDLEVARSYVKEIKDPKLRDEVDERIQKEFRIKENQENVNRENIYNEAAKLVESTKRYDSVPPSMLNSLKPEHRKALMSLEKSLNGIHPPKDDLATWGKYVAMGDNLHKVPVEEIHATSSKLLPASYKELLRRWVASKEAAAGSNKNKKAEFSTLITDEQAVFAAMDSVGWPTIKKGDTLTAVGKKENEKLTEDFKGLHDEFVQAVLSQEVNTGKKMNPKEKRDLADEIVLGRLKKSIKVKKSALGFDFLASDETKSIDEIESSDAIEVPQKIRSRIETQLKSRGIEPSDDKVKTIYLNGLRR